MNHEMEEHCGSCPQDTVDAAPETPRRGGFEEFERFESSRGCQSEHEGGQTGASLPSDATDGSNPLASPGRDQREQPLEPLEHDKLEERFRKECRKSCRRNLFVELLKTVAKVAGVILAAMGLSSFGEED